MNSNNNSKNQDNSDDSNFFLKSYVLRIRENNESLFIDLIIIFYVVFMALGEKFSQSINVLISILQPDIQNLIDKIIV